MRTIRLVTLEYHTTAYFPLTQAYFRYIPLAVWLRHISATEPPTPHVYILYLYNNPMRHYARCGFVLPRLDAAISNTSDKVLFELCTSISVCGMCVTS